jgi:hypothetical protein
MWKVFLAFVLHRGFLLAVALLTLQSSGVGKGGDVWNRFFERVAQGPEARVVEELGRDSVGQVISRTRNPFHWVCVAVKSVTGMRPANCLLLLSNLFLFLFLMEIFALFNRMVTSDISTLGATFVLLWPTSYELSLGSSLTLACFLLTLSLRQALEQNWWLAGLVVAALALMDPIALALLPVFAYLFWSVQRFSPAKQWGRNLGFFLVPLAIGALLSGHSWQGVMGTMDQSALLNLFYMKSPAGDGLFSHSMAGQTLSLIFFFLGAAGGLFTNVNPVHRFLPMGVLLALLLSSPYSALASRAPLAGVCMEGIASASSGTASRIASLLMVLLGAFEVYSVFGAA